MPVWEGAKLGPYEVLSAIGVGGMGTVYKARDTRLERTVAIKVLHEVARAQRERFDREARVVVSTGLKQPHFHRSRSHGELRAIGGEAVLTL